MSAMNTEMKSGFALTLLCLLLVACGGTPGQPGVGAEQKTAPAPPPALADALLPQFPDADFEREHPAAVSVFNNLKLGSEALIHSEAGASVNGTSLDLDGDAGPAAVWGIWRWSGFTKYYPIKLLIDFDMAPGGSFYMLRTNYDKGRWEVVGPLPDSFANDGRSNYPVGNYLSPAGNTYVAILATPGNQLTLNSLTLLSDDDLMPPPVPQNLVATDIQPGSVALDWDDVEADPTLDGYNIYSGPSSEFGLGDPGVVQLNLLTVTDSEFTVLGLVPGSLNHFAVSSVDIVGNESALSNIIAVTTPGDDVPGMPGDLTVDFVGSSTVELHWTAPADTDIQGYNIYVGSELDFNIADGEKQEGGLYPGTSGVREGLAAETKYWARATAVDIYNQESAPGNSVSFTTVDNAKPRPEFIYTPGFPQKDVEILFDPDGTFDPDTESSALTFSWDFNNDTVTDFSSLGPELASWTYTAVGPADVTLSVSDGPNLVKLKRTLMISRRYRRINIDYGIGYPLSVDAVASHPESQELVVLYRNYLNEQFLLYYDGADWTELGPPAELIRAVAISDQGISVLTATAGEQTDIVWQVLRYTGIWVTDLSHTITGIDDPSVVGGSLAVADNGLCSVGLYYYPIIPQQQPVYRFHVWHQRADLSLSELNVFGSGRATATPTGLVRNNLSSYVLDCPPSPSQLDLHAITDGGDTFMAGVQQISGTAGQLQLDSFGGDPGKLYWSVLCDNQRIYYGDNYGIANQPDQYIDAGADAKNLAGCGQAPDNESMLYWTLRHGTGYEELLGYASAGGLSHNFGSGLGFASSAAGSWHSDASGSGVFVVVQEQRDAQIIGRLLEDDTLHKSVVLKEPAGQSSIFSKSAPVVFADDAIYSLHSQTYPTMLVGGISADHETTDTHYFGKDGYVVPHAVCRTMNPSQYLVATNTPDGNLVVNLFVKGQAIGVESLFVEDVNLLDLAFSPGSSGPCLVYSTNGSTGLSARIWDGATWGSAAQLASFPGGSFRRIKLAARRDGNYGITYATDDDKLWFSESSGGLWGPGSLIYSGALNLTTSYIGLDYNTLNRAAIAVQRAGSGIWLGLIPDGGSVAWEELDSLDGDMAFSLGVAHIGNQQPMLVYLKDVGALSSAQLYTCEKINGSWTVIPAGPEVDMKGIPLGLGADSAGNIIITGVSSSAPLRGKCLIYYK